ncbi:MAG: ABC transporter ATP-binding protein [Bacillota bacterium]
MLLEVENLFVYYDTAMILNDVSLKVDAGELVSLVGPNGAGKTTLLRAVTGLINWEKQVLKGVKGGNIRLLGKVTFNRERIEQLPPHEIARRGLIHCPERRRPFAEMTVADNLQAGGYLCKDRAEFNRRLEMVYNLFPRLKDRAGQIAGTLSGGEQQMLAIGRALMMQPKLLCIDEPSLGLAPQVKKNVFEQIKEIQGRGITLLLIEQDVNLAFALSTRNYILSHGRIVAEGSSEKLLGDETIRKSFLGL